MLNAEELYKSVEMIIDLIKGNHDFIDLKELPPNTELEYELSDVKVRFYSMPYSESYNIDGKDFNINFTASLFDSEESIGVIISLDIDLEIAYISGVFDPDMGAIIDITPENSTELLENSFDIYMAFLEVLSVS